MKLVILERDGTINYDGAEFITSAEDWTPLPGALDAIARLNHAGFHVVIATNQPGLGRGLFDVVTLNAIHAKMHKMLAAVGARVDAVFYCPHCAGGALPVPQAAARPVRADRRTLWHGPAGRGRLWRQC